MPGKIDIYGWKGVNTTKTPLQLEDNELTKAQNCIQDPLGAEGAIRKRPGLVKVNAVAAAGSILGMVAVPLPQVITRRFLFGQWTSIGVSGWNTSTDEFATAATTGGPDGFDPLATPRTPQKVWTSLADSDGKQRAFSGRPAVVFKNRLYYAGNDYTVGTTPPTIRMWDGTTDYLLAKLPPMVTAGVGTQSSAILCMVAANQHIYLTTYDGGSYAANTSKGRVFELDPENGVLSQLGTAFPISPDTARIPYAVAFYAGRVWVRTFTGGVTATSQTYFLRPGVDATWVADGVATAPTCDNIVSFQGKLYFGMIADVGVGANVIVRDTLGVYATSRTVLGNEGGIIPVFGGVGIYNHFGAMIVFQNALYCTYFNQEAGGDNWSRIYKYDGTAWTIPYAPAKNTATAVPFASAFIANGKLYFASAPAYDATHNVNIVIRTPDGVTWTNVSSGLTNNSSAAFGMLTS